MNTAPLLPPGGTLPVGWQEMLQLMELPEAAQLTPGPGGGSIGAPLGLRYSVKTKGMYGGSKTDIFFDKAYSGIRYGRKVTIHPWAPMWPKLLKWGSVGPKICATRVIVRAPRFSLRSRRGALVAADGCDPLIISQLEALSRAYRWRRLRVRGDGSGILVTLLLPTAWSQTRPQWTYHLWLAERLAECLGL